MVPFFHSQPIVPPGLLPTAQCHASTLVETAAGDLLAAWFGGTREGHPDTAIWLARCHAGAWSPPGVIADVPGVPLWNPVLFRDRADVLWLFYKVAPTIPAWTGAYLRSVDDGHSWSAPRYLPAGLLGPAKNKPLTLSNGDLIAGTSAETWRSWNCWVETSDDGGTSWRRYGPITVADEADRPASPGADRDPGADRPAPDDDYPGVIQPTLWEQAPGQLTMLMRATRRIGFVCRATSDDFGRSWSVARPTSLPNPNSGIDAVRLADGRIALAYNPAHDRRTPLAVALSEDNGATWPQRRLLETGPGEFSYPAIVQTADGLLHLTYTRRRRGIQHVVLAPDWIASG